jgi:hypothetical protein
MNKILIGSLIFVAALAIIIVAIFTHLIKIPGVELTALQQYGGACLSDTDCIQYSNSPTYCNNTISGAFNSAKTPWSGTCPKDVNSCILTWSCPGGYCPSPASPATISSGGSASPSCQYCSCCGQAGMQGFTVVYYGSCAPKLGFCYRDSDCSTGKYCDVSKSSNYNSQPSLTQLSWATSSNKNITCPGDIGECVITVTCGGTLQNGVYWTIPVVNNKILSTTSNVATYYAMQSETDTLSCGSSAANSGGMGSATVAYYATCQNGQAPPYQPNSYQCNGTQPQYTSDGYTWTNWGAACLSTNGGCDSSNNGLYGHAECFVHVPGAYYCDGSISKYSSDGYNITNTTSCGTIGCDNIPGTSLYGRCSPNACAGVSCNDTCDASGNRLYSGQCNLNNGSCSYYSQNCPYGCLNGQCKPQPNLCSAGQTCSDTCSLGSKQINGYCNQTSGNCVYTTVSCTYGCTNGVCNSPPDLCKPSGVPKTCPDICDASGNQETGGYCNQTSGNCIYTTTNCPYGCTNGVCNSPPDLCKPNGIPVDCSDKCTAGTQTWYHGGTCQSGTGTCKYATTNCGAPACDGTKNKCFSYVKSQQFCQSGVMVISTNGYDVTPVVPNPCVKYGCTEGSTTCTPAPPISVVWTDLNPPYNINEGFKIHATITGLDSGEAVIGEIALNDAAQTTKVTSSYKITSSLGSVQAYEFVFPPVSDVGNFLVKLTYTNPNTNLQESQIKNISFRKPMILNMTSDSQFKKTDPIKLTLFLEPETPLSDFCENTNRTIIATSTGANPVVKRLDTYATVGKTTQNGLELQCAITIDAGSLPTEYSPYDITIYVSDTTGNYNPGKVTRSSVQITSAVISLAFGYSPTDAASMKVGTPITITITSTPYDLDSLTATITNPDTSYSKVYTYNPASIVDANTAISHTPGSNAYTFVWTPTLGGSHYFKLVATKSQYTDVTIQPPNMVITGPSCTCDTEKGTCQANCACDPDCNTCESQGGIIIFGFCLNLGIGSLAVWGVIGMIIIGAVYYVWKSRQQKSK